MVLRVFVQFGVGFFDPFVCHFVGSWAMGFFFWRGIMVAMFFVSCIGLVWLFMLL